MYQVFHLVEVGADVFRVLEIACFQETGGLEHLRDKNTRLERDEDDCGY